MKTLEVHDAAVGERGDAKVGKNLRVNMPNGNSTQNTPHVVST